ncbi:MAG TPA: transglutaminase domain-containing protein, partial [Candidatus Cloacimonadota bacterium]|nr:transglutaminase domain-containing protein [Candidatus Cloacimonadota bacterium]
MPLARQNLARLPYPKAYNKLLKDHNDILMAYLIAYESDANLAQADARDVANNYAQIVDLLAVDGLNYSPEFFLSYIAKQSVSDERISAYRKALLENGLSDVL